MKPIRESLQFAKEQFTQIDSASLDAQVLLADVLCVDRAYLFAHPEQNLTSQQLWEYRQYIKRRLAGEPIAYILGKREFYGLEFHVTPDVLIPRPETEHLVEDALVFAQAYDQLTVVDIGTGSGVIAVSFACHMPHAKVYATDISEKALRVAEKNANQHNANIQFMEGDLAQPIIDANIKLDLLMANLPYIVSDEVPALSVSQYEPLSALDGGADGLRLVERLLRQAVYICNRNARILLEIGAEQGNAVRNLSVEICKPVDVSILQDYAGHDRVVRIQL